jgi:hypothetical protein
VSRSHGQLIERFRAAVEAWEMDARAAQLPDLVAKLNQIERDHFRVPETEIALPSWV